MPWTVRDPPKPAKNWPPAEKAACVKAANAALKAGKSDEAAIMACIGAAKKIRQGAGNMEENSAVIIDLFQADRVLSGEPVCIIPLMPKGFHRHGRQYPPIDKAKIQQFVDNFEARGERGFYQTLVPINVEHEGVQGKVGEIRDLFAGARGAHGHLDLSPEGRAMLQAHKFSYLSPEIRWYTKDVKTGEDIGPTLAGAALTNYPFFGDRLALYSSRAQAQILQFDDESMEVRDPQNVATAVLDLGWEIEDLHFEADHINNSDDPQEARRIMWSGIDHGLSVIADRQHRRALLSLFVATKGGEDRQYPRSAFAYAPEADPGSWDFQIKDYDEGWRLTLDEALLWKAGERISDLPEESRDQALDVLKEAAIELGYDPEKFTTSRTGGREMPPNEGNEAEGAQDFAALQEQMAAMQAELDTYQAGIEERDAVISCQGATISEMHQERLTERFTAQAAGYSAIGADIEVLAAELAWLHQADTSEGQEHLTFFSDLLSTLDAAIADGEAFREVGSSRQPPTGDVDAIVQQRVLARAQELGVAAPVGSQQYQEVLEQVFHEEPELYDRYRAKVLRG